MSDLRALYDMQKKIKQHIARLETEEPTCDICNARRRAEEGLNGVENIIKCVTAEMIPTFHEYQDDVARTQNESWTQGEKVTHALRELAAEVGELNGIYQKQMQGHGVSLDDVAEEAGDVLWGLGALCNALGLHLGIIARDNMIKRAIRYPTGFSAADSIARRDHQ